MTIVRNLTSLAGHNEWNLWQIDVKNTFFYGELNKDVFMNHPQGFVSKEFTHHVCQLKKALYGLKQAPRAWYRKNLQILNLLWIQSF